MTSSIRKFILCTPLIFLPSRVEVPPPPPPDPHPVSGMFKLNDEQLTIAKQVEVRMRDHGFSNELIAGALVNAYAESRLKPGAIGEAGERGIFQLNPRGLGKNMTITQMHDVDQSVDRVARALRRNERMMRLERSGGTIGQHTAMFCREIENPSNGGRKAAQRVALAKKLIVEKKI